MEHIPEKETRSSGLEEDNKRSIHAHAHAPTRQGHIEETFRNAVWARGRNTYKSALVVEKRKKRIGKRNHKTAAAATFETQPFSAAFVLKRSRSKQLQL